MVNRINSANSSITAAHSDQAGAGAEASLADPFTAALLKKKQHLLSQKRELDGQINTLTTGMKQADSLQDPEEQAMAYREVKFRHMQRRMNSPLAQMPAATSQPPKSAAMPLNRPVQSQFRYLI